MYAYDVLTVIANLAGIPASSIKAGEVNGIPVGLQFQAKPLEDAKILRLMSAFEENNYYFDKNINGIDIYRRKQK